MTKKKKKRHKKKISRKELIFDLVLFGIIAVIAIVTVIYRYTGRGSASIKGSITAYFDAINKEDAKKYIKVCYPKKWSENYKPDGNDVDLSNIVENVFVYQSGFEYSDVDIKNREKLEDIFVNRINKGIKDIYGVDLKISECYRVRFSMKMSYEYEGEYHKDDTGVIVRYIYKCNGKWYYLADSLLLVDLNLNEQ